MTSQPLVATSYVAHIAPRRLPARRLETSPGAVPCLHSGQQPPPRMPPQLRAPACRFSGTLPPVKGVSAYTRSLLEALAARGELDLDFDGFSEHLSALRLPGRRPRRATRCTPRDRRRQAPSRTVLVQPDLVAARRLDACAATSSTRNGGATRWRRCTRRCSASPGSRRKRIVMTVHNVEPHEGGFAEALRQPRRLPLRAPLHRALGGRTRRRCSGCSAAIRRASACCRTACSRRRAPA